MVAACERVGVPLERIEDITGGCVNVAHEGMGRHRPLGRPWPLVFRTRSRR